MGVRVSRWVSMHGLALNVTTKLEHFDLIVPCGLAGRMVTSLERELGEACPSMDEVKRVLVERLEEEVTKLRSDEATEGGEVAGGRSARWGCGCRGGCRCTGWRST